MKKMIFTTALVLASTAAMAQKSNFQVKVDLKNFSTDSVIVYKGSKEKITGLDLREFENAITFKVALMVRSYLNSKNNRY